MWILAQKCRIPKIQFAKHMNSRSSKAKMWIHLLEWGTKYPWEELQRQCVKQRLKK
jgi:hypothetical protein